MTIQREPRFPSVTSFPALPALGYRPRQVSEVPSRAHAEAAHVVGGLALEALGAGVSDHRPVVGAELEVGVIHPAAALERARAQVLPEQPVRADAARDDEAREARVRERCE